MGKKRRKGSKIIESGKEVQPFTSKQIKRQRLPREIERINKGWRLIGVRASDWGLPETASPSNMIYLLPKVKGRNAPVSPGLRRQVIGVESKREVYKIPFQTTMRDLDIEEREIDKGLVEEMREIVKRVPKLKRTRLDEGVLVKSLEEPGRVYPLRLDVYEMVYPPKNLAEITFRSKKELLDTVRNIAEYVSHLAREGIKYDDIKLENFAKNDKGLWIVDEEAEYLREGRLRGRDLRAIGRGLARLLVQIIEHPVHSRHKISPDELKREIESGLKSFKGSHIDSILKGFNEQLRSRYSGLGGSRKRREKR